MTLPSLPTVPCLNHGKPGSPCTLNLTALKARITALSEQAFQTRVALEEFVRLANPANMEDRKTYLAGEKKLAGLIEELRLLYATRAHHRGRVHDLHAAKWAKVPTASRRDLEAKFGKPPFLAGWCAFAERIYSLLPLQAIEVAVTWARFSVLGPNAGIPRLILHLAADGTPDADELYRRAKTAGLEKDRAVACVRALVEQGLLRYVEGGLGGFFRLTEEGRAFLEKHGRPTIENTPVMPTHFNAFRGTADD